MKIKSIYALLKLWASNLVEKVVFIDKYPLWEFVPKRVSLNAINTLGFKEFKEENNRAIITTYQNMVFIGPTEPKDFACDKKALKRIEAVVSKVPQLRRHDLKSCHYALINNLICRYITEFSSYPYSAIRTASLWSGDTFVDIGAFRGYVACKASKKVGAKGHVIAIEAIKENAEFVSEHKKLNSLNNLEIINKALSINEAEKIDFYRNENQANSEVKDHIGSNGSIVEVENLSTEELANKILVNEPDRVIISLTTNGTETELAEDILKRLRENIKYLEVILPVIYPTDKSNENLARISKSYTVRKSYPWVTIISMQD